MKRHIQTIGVVIILVLFTGLGIQNLASTSHKLQLNEVKLKDTSAELKSLQLRYDKLNTDLSNELNNKTQNQEHIQKLEQERNQLQQQKQELERQLSVKKQSPVKTPQLTQTAYAGPNCGSDPYMAYIYQHESGCRTTALNSIGCYGIGQSCPASKIAHCGADWGCQNAWFTNYAVTRYGSTYQAYQFWLANRWW